MGFAAGACAWVAVDLWCPVACVPPLVLGHLLPLLVLAGAGALLGRRFFRSSVANKQHFFRAQPAGGATVARMSRSMTNVICGPRSLKRLVCRR